MKISSRAKTVWVLLSAAVIVISVIHVHNPGKKHIQKKTRLLMGTYVTVHVPRSQKRASEAIDAAMDRMQKVASKFNPHDTESPVHKFNEEGVAITDAGIVDLVRLALKISKDSGGAFDITIYPLLKLWGFYSGDMRRPDDESIMEVMGSIGYEHLEINEGVLTKDHDSVKIDLGGIAKGYVVREAVKALKNMGISSAVIDAGGDIYALGKIEGEPWKIGIRMPGEDHILGFVEAKDLAVMGSGDYKRFFTEEDKKYHHIFDPRTGYPVEGLSGMTVIYPDPAIADAWATAFFVLGKERGIEIAEKVPDMEVVMVTIDRKVLYSSGLEGVLEAGVIEKHERVNM